MPKKHKLKQLKSIHELTDIPTRLNRIDPTAWGGGKTIRPSEVSYTSSRWRKLRAVFLREHPLCCFCEAEGKTTAATVVDHIVPHRGDVDLFFDNDNLQPLCQHCHSSNKQKEERESGYY